jgi:hypothetical protein
MLQKGSTRSAEAKPKSEAEAGSRVRKKAVPTPATRTAAGKPSAAKRQEDTYERIQRRAYQLWESEGRPAGREHAHWLQAENEITRARTQHMGMSR